MKSFHFELVNKTIAKYKVFPISTLHSEHDSTSEDSTRTSQHMHKFKHEGDIGGKQISKHFKPLFMGARTSYKQQRREMDSLCMLTLDLGM
jgi:hypothetical protein